MESCTYAIIEQTTTLDKVKELVNKMNDFEFEFNSHDNRTAYQEYKKLLKETFNRLSYESCEDWEEANQFIENNLKVLSVW